MTSPLAAGPSAGGHSSAPGEADILRAVGTAGGGKPVDSNCADRA